MSVCLRCGGQIKETDKFCGLCGCLTKRPTRNQQTTSNNQNGKNVPPQIRTKEELIAEIDRMLEYFSQVQPLYDEYDKCAKKVRRIENKRGKRIEYNNKRHTDDTDIFEDLADTFEFLEVLLSGDSDSFASVFFVLVNYDREYKSIRELNRQKLKAESYKNGKYKRNLLLYFYLNDIISAPDNNVEDVLFEQLKMYEKRFGIYIKQIQSNEKDYISNAKGIIEKMLGKSGDEVVYINTFNYSDLTTIVKDVWHINGDTDNPIFGIDYPNSNPRDFERYKYTKTYRRLELYGNESYYPKRKDYSRILVFGHSLNEQDYSYFYALFNNLKLGTDRSGNRRGYYIEFVYSKYGDKTSAEARKELISRVLKLFYGYNQEILHEQNYRLIDILFCSGAIKFTEIE